MQQGRVGEGRNLGAAGLPTAAAPAGQKGMPTAISSFLGLGAVAPQGQESRVEGAASADVLSSLSSGLMSSGSSDRLTEQPTEKDPVTGLRQVESSLPGARPRAASERRQRKPADGAKGKGPGKPAGNAKAERKEARAKETRAKEKDLKRADRLEPTFSDCQRQVRSQFRAAAAAAKSARIVKLEASLPSALAIHENLALKSMLNSSGGADLRSLMVNSSFSSLPLDARVLLFKRLAATHIDSPGLADREVSVLSRVGKALNVSLLNNSEKLTAFQVSLALNSGDVANLIRVTEKGILQMKDSNNRSLLDNLARLTQHRLVDDLDGNKIESQRLVGRILKDLQISRRAPLGRHNPGLSLAGTSPAEYSRIRMELALSGRSELPGGGRVHNKVRPG